MQQVAVIGAGTMGNGIAHTAAAAGLDVTLIDVSREILDRGQATISANLQRGVDKGRMTAEQKKDVLGRIRLSSRVEDAAGADIVIEAIVEKLEAKTSLFRQLDSITGSNAILASNTSSLKMVDAGWLGKKSGRGFYDYRGK